jgi:hypothetical protein
MIVTCPHCNDSVIIDEINCGIFRHGVLKINGQQMDPHSSKPLCDELFQSGLIYGCGKPFQIKQIPDPDKEAEAFVAEPCDYI